MPAGRALLWSRHGVDLTASFPEIAADLLALLQGFDNVVLDGEIVTPDRQGRPQFARMQRRIGVGPPTQRLLATVPASLFVFDVLLVDGTDLRDLPYRQRALRL